MLRNFRNIIHYIFQSGQIVSYKSFYLLNRTLLCSLAVNSISLIWIEKKIEKNMFVVLRQ